MDKKIQVIIVTYNSKDLIVKCLDSLNAQTHQNFQLTIIDNKSTDETPQIIKSYLKEKNNLSKKTEFISNKTNAGFSQAVNLGLKKVLRKKNIFAALLLNPDIYFTKDLLENGVKMLKNNPKAGAAVPKILYSDHKIWWIGTRVFSNKELLFSLKYGIAEHLDKGKLWKPQREKIKEVEAITGCALLLRTKAVKEIGLLDEKYYMYAEDIDYSIRLKQHGYKLFLFTNSTVFHEVKDKEMNFKVVLSNVRKYKIYLKSVGLFLITYKPLYIFIFLLLKLPYALIFNYLKRKT